MEDFTGKVCLIAGNLGKFKKKGFKMGLGGIIANDFLDRGATVAIVDQDQKVVDKCYEILGEYREVHKYYCDFKAAREYTTEVIDGPRGKKEEVTWTKNNGLDMVHLIVEELGHIDVVVSNFDHFEGGTIENTSTAIYNQLRDTNITPTFKLMAAIRQTLSKQRKATGEFGKVIIITNVVGKAGMTMGSIYSACKGATIGLTKCLAREFARFANVNAVAPGPFAEKKMQGPKDRIKKNYISTQSELSNIPITFESVAPLVRFLASKHADAITGQIMNVDGGMWLKLEA